MSIGPLPLVLKQMRLNDETVFRSVQYLIESVVQYGSHYTFIPFILLLCCFCCFIR